MDVEVSGKGAVLLVDDDPASFKGLQDALNHLGVETVVAASGKEAIALAAQLQPDLIVLDASMPDMDGLQTCQVLKSQVITQEIAVLLALPADETVDRCWGLKCGVTDYLAKPFEVSEALVRINTYLSLQHLQQQLQEQQQWLQREICSRQRAEKILQQILCALSHDLRNPILGLKMVVSNLLKGVGVGSQGSVETVPVPRSTLELMMHGSDRQLNLISTLLDAHTGDTGQLTLQREPLTLSEFIPAVLHDLNPLLLKNKAVLAIDIASDLPMVYADPVQIRRVLQHLIENALKHNPPGIHLAVDATIEGQFVRCSVQDNGIGIPSEQCPQLFELYRRGSNARRTHGLGLGLYLCQQIIQAHGGEINVDSQPASGSSFWFTIPFKSGPIDTEAPLAKAICSSRGQ